MTSDTLASIRTGEVAEPAGAAGLCNIMVLSTGLSVRHGSCGPRDSTDHPGMLTETVAFHWHAPCIRLICSSGRETDMEVVSSTAPRKTKRRVGSGEHFSSFTMKPRLD